MARLRILQADITQLAVDAIVTPANEQLGGGGGIDAQVHRLGGPTILEECQQIVARIGTCRPGHAVLTQGGDLNVDVVIHTVPPAWSSAQGERHDTVLASCYRMSLALADKAGARTVAIPALGTGAAGYPKERAANIAIRATRGFLDGPHRIHEVMFVCVDPENVWNYETLLSDTAVTSGLLA